MKRIIPILLLSFVALAAAAQDTDTKYTVGDLVTGELQDDTPYFIFNSVSDPYGGQERYGFIYATDAGYTGKTQTKPADLGEVNAKYVYKLTKLSSSTDTKGAYHLQNVYNAKYTGPYLASTNASGVEINITPWGKSTDVTKCNGNLYTPEGVVENAKISYETHYCYTIGDDSKTSTTGKYWWNGNNGDESTIAMWSNAHPFRFYAAVAVPKTTFTVTKETLTGRNLGSETIETYETLENATLTAVSGYTFDHFGETTEGTDGSKSVTAYYRLTTIPFEEGNQYYLTIKQTTSNAGGISVYWDASAGAKASNEKISGAALSGLGGLVTPTTISYLTDKNYLWSFEGSETEGYKIHAASMAEGEYLAAPPSNDSGDAVGFSSTEPGVYYLESANGTFYFRSKTVTNAYLNERSGNVGTWDANSIGSTDYGSRLVFTIEHAVIEDNMPYRMNNFGSGNQGYLKVLSTTTDGTTTYALSGTRAFTQYESAHYFTFIPNSDKTGWNIKTETGHYLGGCPSNTSTQWSLETEETNAGLFYLCVWGDNWGITTDATNSSSAYKSLNLNVGLNKALAWSSNDNGSKWHFVSAKEDYETELAESALGETENIGKTGYYAADYGAEAAAKAADGKWLAAVQTLYAAEGTATRVAPKAGHFYRLKGGASGAYIQSLAATSTGDTRAPMATTEDKTTIFMLEGVEGDGIQFKLLSYNTGLYTYKTADVGNVGESETITATEKKVPYYKLVSNYSDGGTILYDNTNKTCLDRNSSEDGNNTIWQFVDIESLPVTIQTIPLATILAPCTLTIPEEAGVEAYTVTRSGEEVVLTQLTGSIPAGTAVMLYLPEGFAEGTTSKVVELPIVYPETPATPSTEGLTGKYERHTTPTAGAFTLQTAVDDEGNRVEGKGQFRSFSGTELAGFRGYIAKTEADNASDVKALSITFGESSEVTAIEEVLRQAHNASATYDLQGRRVTKGAKGIFIVDGKKYIIK